MTRGYIHCFGRYIVTKHEMDAPEKPADGELVKVSVGPLTRWVISLDCRRTIYLGRVAEITRKGLFEYYRLCGSFDSLLP